MSPRMSDAKTENEYVLSGKYKSLIISQNADELSEITLSVKG